MLDYFEIICTTKLILYYMMKRLEFTTESDIILELGAFVDRLIVSLSTFFLMLITSLTYCSLKLARGKRGSKCYLRFR